MIQDNDQKTQQMGSPLKNEAILCFAMLLLLLLPNEPFLIFLIVLFVGSGFLKRYDQEQNRPLTGIAHNLAVALVAIFIELLFLFSSDTFLHTWVVVGFASIIYSLGQSHMVIRLSSMMLLAPILALLCRYLVQREIILDESFGDILGIAFICLKAFDLFLNCLTRPKIQY
jgi:hypothetical protein